MNVIPTSALVRLFDLITFEASLFASSMSSFSPRIPGVISLSTQDPTEALASGLARTGIKWSVEQVQSLIEQVQVGQQLACKSQLNLTTYKEKAENWKDASGLGKLRSVG
jgi:hypothetical protein